MAYTTLQTTWSRPTLMIFSEKKPQPFSNEGSNQGLWNLGGDDRELTIVAKQRKNNIVTLKMNEAHLLSIGDQVIVDGLGGDWDGTFTIINSSPNGQPSCLQYNQAAPDSGDEVFLKPTAYRVKDNYIFVEFDEPHNFYVGDVVRLSILGSSGPTYGDNPVIEDSFFGKYKIIDNEPDNNPNVIKIYLPNPDTGDLSTADIRAMKRKDNIVTLRFYENHPYEIGDIVEITRLGSDWNGVFTILSASTNGNANELTYEQNGDNTSSFTTGLFDGTQNPKKIIRKKRENNQVTLEFSEPHGLTVGTPIVIEGLGETFNSNSACPYFTVASATVAGSNTKIRYDHPGLDTVSTTEYAISSIKREEGQTTIEFSVDHDFKIGDSIIVSGVSISGIPSASYNTFNGTFKILDAAPRGKKNRIRYKDDNKPDIINENPDPIVHIGWPNDFYSVLPPAKAVQAEGGWREDSGTAKGIYNKFVLAPQWIQTGNINKTEYNVSFIQRNNNEVIVELTNNHDYRVGDQITFYGSSVTWGAFNGTFMISETPSANLIKYTDEGTNLERTSSSAFIHPAKTTRVGTFRNPFTRRIQGGGMVELNPEDDNSVVRIKGGGFAPDSGILKITGQDFYYLTDDNRSELQINIERMEYRKRMINGRMRSYHVADKKSFNVSWNNLETKHEKVSEYIRNYEPQPEKLASAKRIVQWYNEHPGSFYLTLIYDAPGSIQENIKYRLEIYEVFFDNFNYSIKYRGEDTDVWDISMSLVEA